MPPETSEATFDCGTIEGITLMALTSKKCSLSRHHTFEPLHRPADDVPLSSAAASNLFSSHAQHLLPNDTNCAAQRDLAPGSLSPVHCFTLHRAIAEPLNKRLTALAMDLERRRDETGVHKSNVGGYQSTADLFFMLGCDDAERLSTCRELHALVSAAVDELRGATGDSEAREEAPTATEEDDGDDADGLPNLLDDESAEPFGAWPWRLGKPPTSSPLLLHPACAWLNVNRRSDSNTVHIHHPQRWSAVYFVASGPGASSPPPPAGHLILRGGRQSKGSASHTYLAVPPTPGTLWFFGGSIPHCVFPLEPQQDEEEDVEIASTREGGAAPRISVAINLEAEVPKKPILEWELRSAAGTAAAQEWLKHRRESAD